MSNTCCTDVWVYGLDEPRKRLIDGLRNPDKWTETNLDRPFSDSGNSGVEFKEPEQSGRRIAADIQVCTNGCVRSIWPVLHAATNAEPSVVLMVGTYDLSSHVVEPYSEYHMALIARGGFGPDWMDCIQNLSSHWAPGDDSTWDELDANVGLPRCLWEYWRETKDGAIAYELEVAFGTRNQAERRMANKNLVDGEDGNWAYAPFRLSPEEAPWRVISLTRLLSGSLRSASIERSPGIRTYVVGGLTTYDRRPGK